MPLGGLTPSSSATPYRPRLRIGRPDRRSWHEREAQRIENARRSAAVAAGITDESRRRLLEFRLRETADFITDRETYPTVDVGRELERWRQFATELRELGGEPGPEPGAEIEANAGRGAGPVDDVGFGADGDAGGAVEECGGVGQASDGADDLRNVAAWHRSKPALLQAALAEAHRAAPGLDELARFLLARMPRRPQASQTIRAVGTPYKQAAALQLDKAVTCPWMALDSETVANVIAVDIDHADALDRVEALAANYGLPRPTLIVDPWSGRGHAVFVLETPVLVKPGARQEPQRLREYAGRLLAAALGGTLMPHRALIKSPWGLVSALIGQRLRRTPEPETPALWEAYEAAGCGLMWVTYSGDMQPVSLRQIQAALVDDFGEQVASPAARRRFTRRRPEPSALGRNCALFDTVRFWAYDTFEKDADTIIQRALDVNGEFPTPLPIAEVAATARSIARFMQTRYKRGQRNAARRDRDAGAGLTAEGRRQLAGIVTAEARRQKTETRIAATVERLRAAGQTVTQKAVAETSGVGLRTVKRHWPGVERRVNVSDRNRPSKPARVPNGCTIRIVAPKGAELAGFKSNAADTSTRIDCAIDQLLATGQLVTQSAVAQATGLSERTVRRHWTNEHAASASRSRRVRRALAQLGTYANAARKRGATASPVPTIDPDLRAIACIRAALDQAWSAYESLCQRDRGRRKRQELTARRREMLDHLRDGEGWPWFRALLARMDDDWNEVEAAAQGNPGELQNVKAKREATFTGVWRSWKSAQKQRRRERQAQARAEEAAAQEMPRAA